MSYDAAELFGGLFGGKADVPRATSQAEPIPLPVVMVCETPDPPESDKRWEVPDFDGLPMPDPCPKCGSLELWWDLLGGVHCQHCGGDVFRRGLELLDRAERIRGRKGAAA